MPRTVGVRYWSETEPPWDSDVPWIVRLGVRWEMTAIGLFLAATLVHGIEIEGWGALVAASGVLTAARALLRPLLLLVTCPIRACTLGAFTLVIDALILAFTAWLSGRLGIAFEVDGFIAAFLGALIVSAISFAFSRLVRFRSTA